MNDKTRKIIGWVLSGLPAAMLLMSGVFKLIGAEEPMEMLGGWGFSDDEIIMIGIGELASTVLFLLPKTSSLGTLLLSSYMGGAIASHMQSAPPTDSYIFPSIFLIVIWVATYFRNPQMFSSITK